MKQVCSALFFTLLMLLTGCNGSSGDNDSGDGNNSSTPTTLALQLLDENGDSKQSFSSAEVVTVNATLRDQFGNRVSGQLITFAATTGVLNSATKLTDSSGVASVTLSSADGSTSAGIITAIQSETLSQSANIEFIAGTGSTDSPTLSVTMLLDGQEVNQFSIGKEVQLQAVLLTADGDPINGEIINFSAPIGNLSSNTALTNSSGLAAVALSSDTAIGAAELIASYSQGTSNVTDTLNYQINAAVAANLVLTLKDDQGVTRVSFDKNTTVTADALLTDDENNPVIGQLVTFETNLGTLSPATKLTDANGLATIQVTNDSAALGAGTITASQSGLSSSVDFEYTGDNAVIGIPTLSTLLTLNGDTVTQFKVDETATITTTLLDADNNPVANQIISFTAEIGTLTPATSLTDSVGVASVAISSSADIGAGVIVATYSGSDADYTSSINYEVLASDAVIVDEGIKLGYFDDTGTFIDGEMKLSIAGNTISAGGTVGIEVAIVDANDERIITPTPITFSSNCVASELATIDATVFTINAQASSTFEDINCGGQSGTDDVIVASVTANGETKTVDAVISIEGESLGSIEFISASPDSIVLKGTGGQGQKETSTLTFLVKSSGDNPVTQQQVDFSLNTEIGGLTLDPTSALTNSEGMVTTRVTAGTVPTAVRVTAEAETTDANNVTSVIKTQSDLLSVNTGLPDQASFSISASVLNPEANNTDNKTSIITVILSDSFNNPVPDGTTVNFTTEGGSIESTCSTTNGTCNVTWTSAEPRVDDHRVTILATALGHETFFDSNGNNTFDDNDGDAIASASVSSGFGRISYQASGFVDMSEAWRDDNEDSIKDPNEIVFLDFNSDQSFSDADTLFNGPQCDGSKCGTLNSIHVRKAIVLVMASSGAVYRLADENDVVLFSTVAGDTPTDTMPAVPEGVTVPFTFSFADTALQTMPIGTTVSVTASDGELLGTTSLSVSNNNGSGLRSFNFFIKSSTDPASPGETDSTEVLTITITSGDGISTEFTEFFVMEGS